MKRGVIGQINGTLGRINSVVETREKDGRQLTDMIEVTGVQGTSGGLNVTKGRAVIQELVDEETVAVTNDEISLSTEATVSTNLTEFLTDGEEFVVVTSSDGVFAFDLFESISNAAVDRANIDLDSFWLSMPEATPWKVGFYGHNGPVENGVVHGESVLDDGIFGSAIKDLKKNQLGLRAELNGREYKFMITRSGYLEIYSPSETESSEFTEFISEKVLPHLKNNG